MTDNYNQSELNEAWTDFLVKVERRKVHRRWSLAFTGFVVFVTALVFFLPGLPLGNEKTETILASGTARNILLPDGTAVTLAPDSELFYPEAFNSEVREVRLKGEAYFDVKSSPEHPFIVLMDGATIRVTGTRFRAVAYPGSDNLQVSLDEGRVEFTPEGHPTVVMQPSQEISYNRISSKSQTQLVFKDCPLEQIMQSVSRIYGVSYRFSDPVLGSTRLSFKIPQYDDVSQLMSLIEIVCRVRVEFSADGTINIKQ